MTTSALFKALKFAADRHRDQRRKGDDRAPYINHCIGVAAILSVEAGIEDEATLLAAILHDTMEDTATTFADIQEQFGDEVARLVEEMTDDKRLPKMRRKELQIEHAPSLMPKTKQLKLADKISNLRDLYTNPPSDWSQDRLLAYLDWTEAVIAGVHGVDETLEHIYDETLAEARKALS